MGEIMTVKEYWENLMEVGCGPDCAICNDL
jgi:hypothetical protein